MTDAVPSQDLVDNSKADDDFGSFEGDVNEGDTIKIKPDSPSTGQYVIIYMLDEGVLSLGDVKVYVKPVVEIEVLEPGEPGGPEEATTGPTDCSSGDKPTDAIDGDDETCFATDNDQTAWWSVNLGGIHEISAVHVTGCGNGTQSSDIK